jgi:polysaccharide export outer membrane protein
MILAMMFVAVFNLPVCASDTDYQVGSGDVLKVSIYDHTDMTTVARVDSDGNILIPLAGSIHVGGMTTAQASREIADKLDGDYIVNPQVSIFVEEFRSKKVVIIGAVVRPGLYELSGPTTLLELISKAGGLSNGAGQIATIRRPATESGGPEKTLTLNLDELIDSKQTTPDVEIYDGDTVTVAKAGVVYVTGQVNRPSSYSLEPGTNVIKAIIMAGGFTQLASQGKVRIIRKIDGKEQVLEKVSMHEVLFPEDVIVVPESFF